jgi:hypothetical protein
LPYFFEGDIVLTPEQAQELLKLASRMGEYDGKSGAIIQGMSKSNWHRRNNAKHRE